MEQTFIYKLDAARTYVGIPFIINSGYRCPKHNKKVGGLPDSEHLFGLAADIKCKDSHSRYLIVKGLFSAGFNRIIQYDTFLHVGMSLTKPQEVLAIDKNPVLT